MMGTLFFVIVIGLALIAVWLGIKDHLSSVEPGYAETSDKFFEEMEKDPSVTHPTYEEIHNACVEIANKINALPQKPDIIFGLVRGGMLPATIISHLTDVPLIAVHYSAKGGKGDNRNHDNELPTFHTGQTHQHIFIIDDIMDSGKTMEEIYAHYTLQKHFVCTAVMHFKDNAGGFVPDHYWKKIDHDTGWIIYPWEVENKND